MKPQPERDVQVTLS